MSIKAMSLVWENYRTGGSEKLALLALADWCDDSGGSLFPSVGAVAKKICASESQARRIIRGFERAGILECVKNQHGGRPGSTRHYRLNLSKLTASADATPRTDATPSTSARDGSHPCASTGSTGARRRVAPMTPYPSVEPPQHPSGTRQTSGFDDFWRIWPRKEAKKEAAKAWAKIQPDAQLLDRILAAVAARVQSRDWLKEGGRFIPLPAWQRWDDELGSCAGRGALAVGPQNYSAGWAGEKAA
jgi:hypothetical protein